MKSRQSPRLCESWLCSLNVYVMLVAFRLVCVQYKPRSICKLISVGEQNVKPCPALFERMKPFGHCILLTWCAIHNMASLMWSSKHITNSRRLRQPCTHNNNICWIYVMHNKKIRLSTPFVFRFVFRLRCVAIDSEYSSTIIWRPVQLHIAPPESACKLFV